MNLENIEFDEWFPDLDGETKKPTYKESKYSDYIFEHTQNVRKAFDAFKSLLGDIFTKEDYEKAEKNIIMHDSSKYSEQEWSQYVDYFYSKRTDEVKKSFQYAWLHHIHHNPHHWQHWVLHEDSRYKVLDMSKEHVIEMICDWWSFGFKQDKPTEIFEWYEQHKQGILLSKKTRKLVERCLTIIKKSIEQGDVHE